MYDESLTNPYEYSELTSSPLWRIPENMGANSTIEYYTTLIDQRLEAYLGELVVKVGGYHPFIDSVHDALKEYLLRRGKRIASCSTLLTYEGYTGNVDHNILDVCSAIELYRHSILIHDDLVDRDEWRRGGRALHTLYVKDYGKRFGEALAIFCVSGSTCDPKSLSSISTRRHDDHVSLSEPCENIGATLSPI